MGSLRRWYQRRALEWGLPILLVLKSGCRSKSALANTFGVSTNVMKRMLYPLIKSGLVTVNDEVCLSEKGMERVREASLVTVVGNKYYVKVRDGCLLVIIKKRKGAKAIRIPCDRVPT